MIKSSIKRIAAPVTRTLNRLRSDEINRVAFWVHTPELINHFAPIWDEFRGETFDIIVREKNDIKDINIRPNWNCKIVHIDDVLARHWRYICLVSNHAGYNRSLRAKMYMGLNLFDIIAIKNIRLQYAAGKIDWNLSDWNSVYDGILCFGPYHRMRFAEKFSASTLEIGYPRFDDFFKKPIALPALREQYNCDPNKKNIVWLPTWTEMSSVGHFEQEIAALSADYNIVVKVHPLMAKHEPQNVTKLRGLGFSEVIEDSRDNLHLYQLADYMLFDYGGPVFGAIYTGKRFILLNVPGAEDHRDAGTSSPEFSLRGEFFNTGPDQNRIALALKDDKTWDRHIENCDRLRSVYFAANYGNSSAVAANAILNRDWLEKRRSRGVW